MKFSKKIISILLVIGIMAACATTALAELKTIVAQDDGVNYEYDLDALNDSFAEYQLDQASASAVLYKDFAEKSAKAFYDDVRDDYVDVADINEKFAEAQLAGRNFDADEYAETNAKIAPASYSLDLQVASVVDGRVVFQPKNPAEITVVDIEAVNDTTIKVKFSDGAIKTYQGQSLKPGDNNVTFEYNGKSYSGTVDYTPPKVVTEAVKFIDYRHFQVIFSGHVSKESAEEAGNYYFFINEGDTNYKAILPSSNQLDTINAVLKASDVNGKTVVDIYLPEDARFTNIADLMPRLPSEPSAEFLAQLPLYSVWTGPYGFDVQAWLDDEESIVVNTANDVHGVTSDYNVLTAGEEVEVAIRNIRDLNGARTIDTAVFPMLIKDEVRPVWENVYAVDQGDTPVSELFAAGPAPIVPIYTDNSERIRLEFSEPVFDTHGLGAGDINNTGHYDIKVFVDDLKVASTQDLDLVSILKFYMAAEDSYEKSCLVDLDIRAAIERAYSDGYRADNTYTIKISGITDLAGNITSPQVIEFKVKLFDKGGDGPIITLPPEIIAVEQIHDNVFRIFMNRDDVNGTFELRNADGEDGLIQVDIGGIPAASITYQGEDVFYKDVYVPATDEETTPGKNVKNDQLLAYDGQNTLNRTLRVFGVKAGTQAGYSYERSLNNDPFVIKKDIYAPIVEDPETIKYDDRDSTIVLDVRDIVPDTWFTGANTVQPVYAMLYDYTVQQEINNVPFGVFNFNSIDTAATEFYNMNGFDIVDWQWSFDLLPIVVSFTKDGVTRSAVISNRNLLNEFANYPGESGRHYGVPGSISYDFDAQQLIIDLAPGSDPALHYNDLLDSSGKLLPGVTYKVEIPSGYFADQAKLNLYDYNLFGGVNSFNALYFVPDDGILYVSDARNNNAQDFTKIYPNYPAPVGNMTHSYMVHGYTSNAAVVTQSVEPAPVVIPDPDDAVPQTSKELINWVTDRNEIWVEFTGGQIDLDTLKNPANYVLNDINLASMGVTSDDIRYEESNENVWVDDDVRKFAVIKLPYETIDTDGDYSFSVSGVSNLAGGTMTPVEVRIDIGENYRPVIESAKVIGNHEIELTFNESVRYTADPAFNPENLAVGAKDNFKVYVNGIAITPESATVGTTPLPFPYPNPPYPLNKIVRLDVGSVELLEADVTIKVEVVVNQNGKIMLEDKNCNPLNIEAAPFVVK